MFAARRTLFMVGMFASALGAGLMSALPVQAQQNTYGVGENRGSRYDVPRPSGVRRLARIEYVSGKVTWRANERAKWGKAGVNRSLEEGAQVWAEQGGRAEIRFDDGSLLRLGSEAAVTLEEVSVDAGGEYTRIKMTNGVATLIAREERSVFAVETPSLSVKTAGASRLRVGVGDDVEIAVSRGRANLAGTQGKITLESGDFVSVRAGDKDYVVNDLPKPDSWEDWNYERDRKLAADARPVYHAPGSRTNTSVFLSLGFPLYSTRYVPVYHEHHGWGSYRHRW